jgi:hypothetical protein
MSNVLAFLRHSSNSRDWNQQELAEFYRVEAALLQSGFSITTARGLTDEDDPWFVFCRADNEEVIAHFARVGAEYIIVSNFFQGAVRGRDFRALIRQILDSHPLMRPLQRRHGQKVFLHPAALLTALIASAYVISDKHFPGDSGAADGGHGKNNSLVSMLLEKFSVLAAAVFAVTWIENHGTELLKFFESSPLFHGHDKADYAAAELSAFNAVWQAIHNLEANAHRSTASDDGSHVLPSHGGHEHFATVQGADATLASLVTGKSSEATSSAFGDASPTNSQNPDGGHGDSDAVHASPQFTLPPVPTVGSSDAAALVLATDNAVPNSSEAYHLAASELGNFSAEAVVLSNGSVSVGQALQQAFQQVGFDPELLHTLATTSVNGAAAGSSLDSAALSNGHPSTVGATGLATEASAQPVAIAQPVDASHTEVAQSATQTASVDAQAMQVVAAFLHDTPAYEITLSGANVVIIDTHTADAKLPDFSVMTFDMSDGSTLSIVGIIPSHAQLTA